MNLGSFLCNFVCFKELPDLTLITSLVVKFLNSYHANHGWLTSLRCLTVHLFWKFRLCMIMYNCFQSKWSLCPYMNWYYFFMRSGNKVNFCPAYSLFRPQLAQCSFLKYMASTPCIYQNFSISICIIFLKYHVNCRMAERAKAPLFPTMPWR